MSFSLVLLSYFIPLGLAELQFLCTIPTLLVKMSQFQSMENLALIIIQVLLKMILDEV